MSHSFIASSLCGRAGLTRWFTTPKGAIALQARLALLRSLVCGWPRRSRSMLVMAPGTLVFPEVLHDAGFDVTIQEDDRFLFNTLCAQKSACMGAVLAAPDHLPFDDNEFDYAVVVAGLEFWAEPQKVLHEINRVTRSGCLLLFAHTVSCYGFEQMYTARFCKKKLVPGSTWRMSQVQGMAFKAFSRKASARAFALPLPSWLWGKAFATRFATRVMPFPVGAVAGMKIDFGDIKTGTPLLLTAREVRTMY